MKEARTCTLKLRLVLLLSLCYSSQLIAQPAVQLWEEQVVIPTYPVGPADLNPIFYAGRSYQGAKGPVYPYPLYADLSETKEDRVYRAVYLENEFLQISVLPELGGRIFSGVDKTNGYDFFYRQHVIKPALIGMIGAWISGGVEWNIPHHHRASTFLPVDYRLVENEDGSKTVWIGETERRHRMRWIVGLTLYPDKSYIEATIKLFNRTPLPHSILYFANVAVHANEEYQVLFPPGTEYGTQHAKREFIEWPVASSRYAGIEHDEVDVSWWKNHPTPISIFAWNYEDDFMGGYDHGRQAGVAYFADHHVAPGKKFFEFANGDQGRMWDKILTDSDGPYLELMSGAFSDNQPDYSWVQPHEVKIVKQYWYPIRELDGVKNANLDAAVNLDVDDSGRARFAFNTTSGYHDAVVALSHRDEVLFEQVININPDRPFSREITLPAGFVETDLEVSISSSDGKTIIAYRPEAPKHTPMPDPVNPPGAPENIETNEELYLTGLRLEQFYSPALEPYPYYEEALRRDPGDSRANTALGILYAKRGMFGEAEERFQTAVDRITTNYTRPKNGEAYYYLGVVQKAQGKYIEAQDAFFRATWDAAWYSAAHYALAELACLDGDYEKALVLIDRTISTSLYDTKASNLKTAILRRLGRIEEAARLVIGTQRYDPLDFWAGNERLLVTSLLREARTIREVQTGLHDLMRNDPQSYLELAVDYGNAGFFDEAVAVLQRGVEAAPDQKNVYPMLLYYLGYYSGLLDHITEADGYFSQAAAIPPDYCFPFRWESRDVLEAAVASNPRDARAFYYLGNLLFDHQPENAIAAWEKAIEQNQTFSIAYRNLGLAYDQIQQDTEKAIVHLEIAVALHPNDGRLYAELDDLYEKAGISPALRLVLLQKNHKTLLDFDPALKREIKLLTLVGDYDRALEIMDNHHFHLWEGETGVHALYVDAHLLSGHRFYAEEAYQEALAHYEDCLEYPLRFETGRPYGGGGRLPEINYYLGIAHHAHGEADLARAFFDQAVSGRSGQQEVRFFQGLANRELGRDALADEIFETILAAGRERLAQQAGIGFFDKFGGGAAENVLKAEAHYWIGLGLLGQGKHEEARAAFEESVRLDVTHLGAQTRLTSM